MTGAPMTRLAVPVAPGMGLPLPSAMLTWMVYGPGARPLVSRLPSLTVATLVRAASVSGTAVEVKTTFPEPFTTVKEASA